MPCGKCLSIVNGKEKKKGWQTCVKEEKEFITISPTMIEATGFNVLLDSRIPGVLVLVDSNGHICIVDIRSIGVVDWYILDNVGGRKLVWRRSTLQCKTCRFVRRVLHHLQ